MSKSLPINCLYQETIKSAISEKLQDNFTNLLNKRSDYLNPGRYSIHQFIDPTRTGAPKLSIIGGCLGDN